MNMKKICFLAILLSVCFSGISFAQSATDITPLENDTTAQRDTRHWYNLYTIGRSYGDSVVLRWAPDEYVPWRLMSPFGYMVVRVAWEPNNVHGDTLATNIRPWPKQKFMDTFAANDTLAAGALQMCYGKAVNLDETETQVGSFGSVMEVYDQQQDLYSYAMMIAEMRPDLAQAMGLGFVDKTVKRGVRYDYIVRPMVGDTLVPIRTYVTPIEIDGVYKRPEYSIQIQDSIIPPNTVILSWPKDNYTYYDIERLKEGEDKWIKINKNPYMSLVPDRETGDEMELVIYSDSEIPVGKYKYRIRAYDSFGDYTEYCEPIEIEIPDLVPPSAPLMKRIVIDRTEDAIYATIEFRKDSIEPDLKGYLPCYSNKDLFGDAWVPLVKELVPPTDSTVTVNVTGLPTGTITIAAYDIYDNASNSVPLTIRIEDMVPPSAPKNIRTAVSPTGQVIIAWSPNPEPDVMHYEVYTANDTLHTFMQVPGYHRKDTVFMDTISIKVAQPYYYYKIKAVDFSGNESPFSELIRIERPNLTPPQYCRLDSIYRDEKNIYSVWYPSPEPDISYFKVYRRLSGEEKWTMIKRLTPDSIVDNRLLIVDNPPINSTRRYHYAIQSVNRTGVQSQLSLQAAILHAESRLLKTEITLQGAYREEDKVAALVWDATNLPDDVNEVGYYVILRTMEGAEYEETIRTVSPKEHQYSDKTLPKGKTASYRVRLRTKDGRFSNQSNYVTIKNTSSEQE